MNEGPPPPWRYEEVLDDEVRALGARCSPRTSGPSATASDGGGGLRTSAMLTPIESVWPARHPKTGTTRRGRAFGEFADIRSAARRSPEAHEHAGVREVHDALPAPAPAPATPKTVCVVREPVDWLGSWYRFRSQAGVRHVRARCTRRAHALHHPRSLAGRRSPDERRERSGPRRARGSRTRGRSPGRRPRSRPGRTSSAGRRSSLRTATLPALSRVAADPEEPLAARPSSARRRIATGRRRDVHRTGAPVAPEVRAGSSGFRPRAAWLAGRFGAGFGG